MTQPGAAASLTLAEALVTALGGSGDVAALAARLAQPLQG